MDNNYIECPELSGKTIQTLRIYQDIGDGSEIQFDLTDGTSFSYCVSHSPVAKASWYKRGAGSPEIIRDYEI